MSKKLTNLFRKPHANIISAITAGVLIIIAGVVVLRLSAAGFFTAVQPELSTIDTNAQIINDTSASGGKALQFTSPTTPPPPSGSTSCALPKYPTPACTGVPAGTVFSKEINGDYTATTANEVIDKWHIKGNLIVKAANVTVKNSLIDGNVNDDFGNLSYSFSLTDTTVGPTGTCDVKLSTCDDTGHVCNIDPAAGGTGVRAYNFTATRVHVRGWDHAFQLAQEGGYATIRDSYTHVCGLGPEKVGYDGTHSDPFQAYCPDGPCGEVILDHNTFDARNPYHTGPVFAGIGPFNGYNVGFTLTNNLLVGGVFTIYIGWQAGPDFTVTGNRLVDKSWDYGPVDTASTCAHQKWSDNTLVTIDDNYNITSTVGTQNCVN